MSSCTVISGFRLMFKVKFKSEFAGVSTRLDDETVIGPEKLDAPAGQRVTCKMYWQIRER